MAASTTRISPLESEVTITRMFDAPRELVFEAWTQPAHLKRWWGPHDFTNPVCEVDLRVGGRWKIVMRFSRDGSEHTATGEYREIVPPERLVFTNIALDKDGKHLLEGVTTVTLEDLGGKTKLTLHTRMKGLVPYADRMLDGMEPGWSQSLERLAAELAKL
jgi:uncharacterized protein YndB with AHSA1/START domain